MLELERKNTFIETHLKELPGKKQGALVALDR